METLPRIPLFPLNAHIFPGGRLNLRIFEARYLRMVKECAGQSPAFAMGMMAQGGQPKHYDVLPFATLVDIIDFRQLPDGLLGITIQGRDLISISEIQQDSDGLRRICYQTLPMWPQPAAFDTRELAEKLALLMQEFKDIAELYQDVELRDSDWYVGRWLEMLPLEPETKIRLLRAPDAGEAITLIRSIISK